MEQGTQQFFQDPPPRKDFWLLFKVSSYERLCQMRTGTLYMNSLEFFSSLKEEESIALRVDEFEKVYGILRAGKIAKGYSTLSIKIGESDEEIDLGPEAILRADFPQPKNMMLFCMGALSDDQGGIISGEENGIFTFDPRFLEFGTHVLFITNATEFAQRINVALTKEANAFSSPLIHEGFGMINYRSLDNYSGAIGLFTKDSKYSWQREFRISFGVENQSLNSRGAYELQIGDISDISHISSVQAMIDNPITIKRRSFRKTVDWLEQITDTNQ